MLQPYKCVMDSHPTFVCTKSAVTVRLSGGFPLGGFNQPSWMSVQVAEYWEAHTWPSITTGVIASCEAVRDSVDRRLGSFEMFGFGESLSVSTCDSHTNLWAVHRFVYKSNSCRTVYPSGSPLVPGSRSWCLAMSRFVVRCGRECMLEALLSGNTTREFIQIIMPVFDVKSSSFHPSLARFELQCSGKLH